MIFALCALCAVLGRAQYHSKGWFFGLLSGFLIAAYKFKQTVDENKVRVGKWKMGRFCARMDV